MTIADLQENVELALDTRIKEVECQAERLQDEYDIPEEIDW
jgi:hypothetical protein